jgi:MFS family permease
MYMLASQPPVDGVLSYLPAGPVTEADVLRLYPWPEATVGALTEGLNWTTMALGVGAAVGAWMAGLIADSAGGRIAFLVSVVAGGTAVIMAVCGRGRLLTR